MKISKILIIFVFLLNIFILCSCRKEETTTKDLVTTIDSRFIDMGRDFERIDINNLETPRTYEEDPIDPYDDFGEGLSYKIVAHANENTLYVDGAVIYLDDEDSSNIELYYEGSTETRIEIIDSYKCTPDLIETIDESQYIYISFKANKNAFPVINSGRKPYEDPFNDISNLYKLLINSKEASYEGLILPDLFNLYKGEAEFDETIIRYMAYKPIEDNKKNPLIIWLHGAGEGGTSPEIAVLGNEVTALFKDEIQNYFKKDGSSGAYVLVPQCETMWMDANGTGSYSAKSKSFYTEYLIATIFDFVENNEDIDTSRIYIGGCSNGGFMTFEMAFQLPDYFAAIYPICPGYLNTDVSQEMIYSLRNTPTWIVQSIDDVILNPKYYGEPIYARLIEFNNNCFYTMFDKVRGTDMPDVNYIGHYSWVYLFNNEVKKVQSIKNISYNKGTESNYGFIGTYEGGTETVENYDGIWDWMSNQKR
ncbi:prolyl oligopeptidase family serine peptidase [bacterium]|nr:prolyl oligopeptidase family serine peptidase [bacterium]